MASESVKKILEAEAEADRLTDQARKKAEDMVIEAQQKSAVKRQKKLAEAKSEIEKIRQSNAAQLKEYSEKAQKECANELEKLKQMAHNNSDKAVSSVIDSFFS